MTKEEFGRMVKIIRTAYPREDFVAGQEAFNLWYGHLKDLKYMVAEKAVDRYIDTSRYAPTIADIRTTYEEVRAELRNQLHLVKQELQMFEWKFCMGYNGQRLECEREFERLTVGKCGNDYALARKLGIEIRRRSEEYIENGGTMYLLDWLRAQE